MRNPALRLVGIASSPSGGGVFGTRAEEELRLWLESRLDALGIDPVAYSRFVLSLLRRPDSALSPGPEGPETTGRIGGRRNRVRARTRLPLTGDREQRRTVVQCLTSAADQKCGVESLVDELCAKLRDLEGGGTDADKDDCRKLEVDTKSSNFESLTPRDRALRYYAAFPALQPSTPKKTIQKRDKNSGTNNFNKCRNIGVIGNNNNKDSNNKNNNNSNNNNKGRHKKTKMSIHAIGTRRTEDKETFGFAKSMEREREKESELELDELRLAQLQAKFDESLEALWDSGPGISQDKSSIWSAPSLSIPSGPLWPVDTGDMTLILPITNSVSSINTPYQESIVDNSSIIPWDIGPIGIGKCTDDNNTTVIKDKVDHNLNWSNYNADAPWCWKDLGNNLANMDKSPKTKSGFIPIPPQIKKTVEKCSGKESVVSTKVNSTQDVEEDLLTSAKTHFRPIKDDGRWADGTTFPVNNNFERVAYRRSESGNLLYLPDGESPYMEYRETTTPSPSVGANFSLKFRVRQCDKAIQTDPIRSPVKRRILAEENHFYYTPIEDILTQEADDAGKDSFVIGDLDWIKPSVSLLNDRKRRHSSSFKCRPLAALRPLTL